MYREVGSLQWDLATFSKHLFTSNIEMVKTMPAMRETWVQSLGWEDPWKREWLPTAVFLPEEFHGQRSLADYNPWGRKELHMTE